MLLGVIIACEVGFWLFVLGGLATRYLLPRPRAGAALLWCAPGVDLLLLAATLADLQTGGTASASHALAGVYLGVSVAFGPSLIRWADERFAYRFAAGPAPSPKPRVGRAHAARERHLWLRHVYAWAIGCGSLLVLALAVGDKDRAEPLLQTIQLWSIVLVIDGVVSLSYSVRPRR